MSTAIDQIDSPAAVKALAPAELPVLAASLRGQILSEVSRTGGHLASSLGAVELSIALARVFEPSVDRVVWDVGHQTYAWKMLTGRRTSFGSLRRFGGISGFCAPEETPCDAFVSGHAGVAFAVAEGMAVARDHMGAEHQVVAVVGDASFCNGETLEALNSCAQLTRKMVVVLNDNGMSISRSTGAMARVLGRLISGVRYNRIKKAAEAAGHRMRLTFLRGFYHGIESYVKSLWLGNAFFERYGLRYVGPVDGHNLAALEAALTVAREEDRSVVVHVVTVKGRGFPPAEQDPGRWHGVGPFDPEAVLRGTAPHSSSSGWSDLFGAALCELARDDDSICALTAAMKDGTGLRDFAANYPTRFYDVGICESQLVSVAAGLAKSGMRPVVAVYSSFLQRAVDQVMHDVCLLNLPVVFAVDRAGCVGSDGRTHHGMFDIPMLRCLPNLTMAQPKDGPELAAILRLARTTGGPWVIRYPRGVPQDVHGGDAAEFAVGKAEQICGAAAALQIWALGDQVAKAMAVSRRFQKEGVEVGVVNARFVKPLDEELLARQVATGAAFVTLENGTIAGGFGSAVAESLTKLAGGRPVRLLRLGWPDTFISHGTVAELEAAHGLTAEQIAEQVWDFMSGS